VNSWDEHHDTDQITADQCKASIQNFIFAMLKFQLSDQGANSSLISYSGIPNTASVRDFCLNYALSDNLNYQ
jgi:hypothetical protein